MESLTVRNLPDGTKAALRDRANRHGRRSVEDEVRTILIEAAHPAWQSDWFDGLAERAIARARGRPQTPSERLVRDDRDSR